jgi:hypothetical protein
MFSTLRTLIAAGTVLSVIVTSAHATCGTRGGPGYRGPDGKCVGWATLGRVCGNPPTTRCTAEQTNPSAPDAAQRGLEIDKMKERAHSHSNE